MLAGGDTIKGQMEGLEEDKWVVNSGSGTGERKKGGRKVREAGRIEEEDGDQ